MTVHVMGTLAVQLLPPLMATETVTVKLPGTSMVYVSTPALDTDTDDGDGTMDDTSPNVYVNGDGLAGRTARRCTGRWTMASTSGCRAGARSRW